MLEKVVEQILRENPNLVGMDDVIEKEVIHHDILYVLHQKGFLGKLTFMGGTSLRLCYGGSRLSEDLDFTCGDFFIKQDFKGMAEYLESFLQNKYQINVSVREPQKPGEGNTSTWKITLEKCSGRPDLPSQKMHVDICSLPSFEVEHRAVVNHYNLDSQIIGLPIPVQSQREIMADKMIAFAYRKRRIKPRDVWDIVYLTQKGMGQDYDLVSRKLAVRKKNKDEFVGLLKKHTDLIKESKETKQDFYQELTRFLPKETLKRTLQQEQFWSYVGNVIEEQCNTIINFFQKKTETLRFKL